VFDVDGVADLLEKLAIELPSGVILLVSVLDIAVTDPVSAAAAATEICMLGTEDCCASSGFAGTARRLGLSVSFLAFSNRLCASALLSASRFAF
jgi:hypothetical protein